MSDTPEAMLLRKLAVAAQAVAVGAKDALDLLGAFPLTPAAFAALGKVERTAARALLKAVEQWQDILARMFRTFLIAEQANVSEMSARDIANRLEKLGGLSSASRWSSLVRLRNRLAREYPVSVTEQMERVASAIAAVPLLEVISSELFYHLRAKGYLA